ncbi:MAG: menaquinone biosynthesis protein [Planctomycetota bacterium]|nr:menaquinone biosynthesis protein [Planctomycetota bacterium]
MTTALPITIGVVRYINTLPLIDGLAGLAGCTLVPDVPARLIDRLVAGEVDIALCSVIDLVRSPVPVRVVPVGMLGCCGRTLTVRLYSRRPWAEVRTVAADTDSHTSRALAELVLRKRFGANPIMVDFNHASGARDPGTDAMLLIGDKVINDAPAPDAWPLQLDLGEEWHAWTGLPFVFATWLVRVDADEAASARVRTAARVLDHQRRHNAERIDGIIAREAEAHGWPAELARQYLTELLRFEFDEAARAGLSRFLQECRAAGLAPAANDRAEFADFTW